MQDKGKPFSLFNFKTMTNYFINSYYRSTIQAANAANVKNNNDDKYDTFFFSKEIIPENNYKILVLKLSNNGQFEVILRGDEVLLIKDIDMILYPDKLFMDYPLTLCAINEEEDITTSCSVKYFSEKVSKFFEIKEQSILSIQEYANSIQNIPLPYMFFGKVDYSKFKMPNHNCISQLDSESKKELESLGDVRILSNGDTIAEQHKVYNLSLKKSKNSLSLL